jgi:hypothetical protein
LGGELIMFDEVLKLMRDTALAGRVYLTIHANRELKDDDLTVGDVINCLMTGEIVEQQFDDDWQEEKYVIYGDARNNDEMAVTAKLGYNKTTIVITVFRLRITDYDY